MIIMIIAWYKLKLKFSSKLSRGENPVMTFVDFFEGLLAISRQSVQLESCSKLGLVYAYLISWF